MICAESFSDFSSDEITSKNMMKDVGRLESDISELSRLVDSDENLEDIEGLIGECSGLLKSIKDTDLRCVKDAVFETLNKVEMGLDLIRQRLLTCAYFKLSAQELTELRDDSVRPADPSVEFFGLEWTSVFSRCYSLGVELRLLKAGMKQDRFSTVRLTACLSLVNQLIAETQMHAAALNSGRLSSNHLSLQLRQQQIYTNIGRASSFRNMDNSACEKAGMNKRKQQKYTGSKTDSALATREHRQKSESKKVSVNDKQKCRKSSILNSFSNIFKAGLKL